MTTGAPPDSLAVDDRGGRSGRGRSPRARLVLTVVAIVIAACAIGIVAAEANAARASMQHAREDVEQGLAAVRGGRIDRAAEHFDRGRAGFADAGARLDHPLVRAAAVAGPDDNLEVAHHLAAAGELLAGGAADALGAVARSPGGVRAFAPRAGALPVTAYEEIAPVLVDAQGRVAAAVALVDGAPRRFLLPSVNSALLELEAAISEPAETLEAVSGLAVTMPDFLGASGARRYLVVASNPAELRGTGGFLGAYAIATFDGGRLEIGGFAPIQDLQDIPVGQIEAPDPAYAARYDRYGGAGFWLNINMTPDFPTAAAAMVRLYEAVETEALDGVIVADPRMLAALLTISGPAAIPGVGELDAGNVVDYVTNEAYATITDPEIRKRVLGTVAAQALRGLLTGAAAEDSVTVFETLATEAAAGHLQLYSRHAEEQAAFLGAGLAGELPDAPHDFLSVIVNNAAANKADYYADRSVEYEVALSADGSASAVARVTLTNRAPTGGLPPYVIGPNVEGLSAGDNLSLLSVYAPHRARLQDMSRSAGTEPVGVQRELGRPVYTTSVHLRSGATEQLDYAWTMSEAWGQGERGGPARYRFTFASQRTLNPTTLRLSVRVPPGTEVISASDGLRVSGDQVHFDGVPAASATFEVQFAPVGPESSSDRVRDWLARPLW